MVGLLNLVTKENKRAHKEQSVQLNEGIWGYILSEFADAISRKTMSQGFAFNFSLGIDVVGLIVFAVIGKWMDEVYGCMC